MDIDARCYHGSLASVGFSASTQDNQYDEGALDRTISVIRNSALQSWDEQHRNDSELQKYLKNPLLKFDQFDQNVPNQLFTNVLNEVTPCAVIAPQRLRENLERTVDSAQSEERARVDLVVAELRARNAPLLVIQFVLDLFQRDLEMTKQEQLPIAHNQEDGYMEEFLEYPICGDSCCSCKERLHTRVNPLYKHPPARALPMTQYSMHPSVFGIGTMCGFTVAAPGRLLKLTEDGFCLNSKEHLLVSRQKEYAEWRYGIVQQSSLVRAQKEEEDLKMNDDMTLQAEELLVPEDWDQEYMQDTMYSIHNSRVGSLYSSGTASNVAEQDPLASAPAPPEAYSEHEHSDHHDDGLEMNADMDVFDLINSNISVINQNNTSLPVYTSDAEASDGLEDLCDEDEEDDDEEETPPMTHEEKMALCEQVWKEFDNEERDDRHNLQRVPYFLKRNTAAQFLQKFHMGVDNALQWDLLPDFSFGDVDDSAGIYQAIETMHLQLARAGLPNVAVQPNSATDRFLGCLGALRFFILFNSLDSVLHALQNWSGENVEDLVYSVTDKTMLQVLQMVGRDEAQKRQAYLLSLKPVLPQSSTIERQADLHELQLQSSATPTAVVVGSQRAVAMHRIYHHCRSLGLSSTDADARWRALLAVSGSALGAYDELCQLDTQRNLSADKLVTETAEDLVNQYFMDYVTIYGTRIGMRIQQLFGLSLPVPQLHLPTLLC